LHAASTLDGMTVTPGRRSRAPWIAAGLVAFVLFAGGVTVSTYVGMHHKKPVASDRPTVAPPPPPSPTPSPTPSAGPSGIHNAALSSYLVEPPDLATPVGVRGWDPGAPLSIAQATTLSPLDPLFEGQQLNYLKYLDGAATGWLVDEAEVIVAILQFASPDFANGYFAQEQARVAQLCRPGDVRDAVYLPGSLTLLLAKPGVQHTRFTRTYASRGDIVIVVLTIQRDASLNWGLPEDPLVKQYNKL
jgi:hypothetical protein